jgi:hypothetical protein
VLWPFGLQLLFCNRPAIGPNGLSVAWVRRVQPIASGINPELVPALLYDPLAVIMDGLQSDCSAPSQNLSGSPLCGSIWSAIVASS